MRLIPRLALAATAALAILSARMGDGTVAQARHPALAVVHASRAVTVLVPGAPFTVVTTGLGGLHASYCLGLVSLHDRFGLPVSLGIFRPGDDGLMMAQARVPMRIFPAEPAGEFLLYAGRCTTVAPDGNFASITVMIVPALG